MEKAANGADILSDVYNANPTAMKLILETFSAIPKNEGGKKIAVLADMKELGEQSVQLHTQMLLSLTPDAIDTVISTVKTLQNCHNLLVKCSHLVMFIISRKQLTKTNLTLWSSKSKKAWASTIKSCSKALTL